MAPGLQTGYCADTGGGWSLAFAAHESQIHYVPGALPDEAAVLIEPQACAVHAALQVGGGSPAGGTDELTAVVIGAGTLGLCTIAALARLRDDVTRIIAVAKYSHQKELAAHLGATSVAEPGDLRRAVRRATASDPGQRPALRRRAPGHRLRGQRRLLGRRPGRHRPGRLFGTGGDAGAGHRRPDASVATRDSTWPALTPTAPPPPAAAIVST